MYCQGAIISLEALKHHITPNRLDILTFAPTLCPRAYTPVVQICSCLRTDVYRGLIFSFKKTRNFTLESRRPVRLHMLLYNVQNAYIFQRKSELRPQVNHDRLSSFRPEYVRACFLARSIP